MTNHVSKALLALGAILLCVSLMNAQRRTSASPSIPDGRPITVSINEDLSSESAEAGDTFTGTLAQPVMVNGKTVFPEGAVVAGRVTSAKKSGRLNDPGVLELRLVSIRTGAQTTKVSSQLFMIKGASHTKSNVAKIGGGTAAGAIIGAIVGGGKGAAIGAGIGAGAGTATAAATGKKPATVESEAVLTFLSGYPAQATAVRRPSNPEYNDSEPSASESHARQNNDSEPSAGESHARRERSRHGEDGDDEDDDDDRNDRGRDSGRDAQYSFSEHDHQVMRGCLADYEFESLPPGIQKKLARGGTLPPGQARRVHALPGSCTARLPGLPRDVRRIIFGDRVVLVDSSSRILDIFIFARY